MLSNLARVLNRDFIFEIKSEVSSYFKVQADEEYERVFDDSPYNLANFESCLATRFEGLTIDNFDHIINEHGKIRFDAEVTGYIVYRYNARDKYRTNKITAYVECQMLMEETIKRFKVLGVYGKRPVIDRTLKSLRYNSNLVPDINDKNIGNIINDILNEYPLLGEFNKVVAPVDIKRIIEEEFGIIVVDSYSLMNGIAGLICLTNETITTLDGVVKVTENTILIDSKLKENIGRYNFTLAHELSHFIFDKEYLYLRRLTTHEKCVSSLIVAKGNDKFEEDRIERHADILAARLLMPAGNFTIKLTEIYNKYNFPNCDNQKYAMSMIIKELASFYHTSLMATAIRIKELNILTSVIDPVELVSQHNVIYADFANKIYDPNILCRAVCDTKTFDNIPKNDKTYNNLSKKELEILHNEDRFFPCLTEDIHTTIKNLRKFTKITFDELEFNSGIGRSTIAKIERMDEETPDPVTIVKICKGMEVPRRITKKVVGLIIKDFDVTTRMHILELKIDLFYEMNRYEFFAELDKIDDATDTITDAYKVSRKA